MCGNGHKYRTSAPILRNQFIFCQLLLHFIHIGAGFVNFVDGDDDLHTGRLRMVDGLHGLGHHAVVRGNHQDCDVRGLGAAHTHGGERLMSRGIQECDLAVVDLDHGSTDMLGDSARLSGRHIALADRIEQGGFTVVNVAHDTHNRRSGTHVVLVLLVLLKKLGDHIHLHFLLAQHVELQRDLLRFLVVDLLVQCHDLSL